MAVIPTVPGEERHASSGDGADAHRRGRVAERRGHLVIRRPLEELVEPRPADDTDLGTGTISRGGGRIHGGQVVGLGAAEPDVDPDERLGAPVPPVPAPLPDDAPSLDEEEDEEEDDSEVLLDAPDDVAGPPRLSVL